MIDYDELKKYDDTKTKILKYVLYKKRTEYEIRKKFEKNIENEMLEKIIDELKQYGYIDDNQYIDRSIDEFIALKNLSLKQIKYKLLSKGLDKQLIEDYFYNNDEKLNQYECNSINNLINKNKDKSDEELAQMLYKKGFKYDNIKEVKNSL